MVRNLIKRAVGSLTMLMEKNLNALFEMHAVVEYNLFKNFFKQTKLPEGLKHRHMRAIVNLHFKGKTTMSEMSQLLNIEKGSFTTVADKIIKLGYAKNERSEKDRRVYELTLTEAGESLAKRFIQEHRDFLEVQFDKLDEKKMAKLSEALDVVNNILKEVSAENDFGTPCE